MMPGRTKLSVAVIPTFLTGMCAARGTEAGDDAGQDQALCNRDGLEQ